MAFLSLSGCYASLVNAEWPSLSSLWLVAQCWGTCVASRSPESPPLHGSLPRETGLLPGSSTSPLGFQKLLRRQHAPAGPWLGVWAGQPCSGSSPAIFCGCPWLTGNARIPAYQRARSFHSLSLCLSLLLPPPAPFSSFFRHLLPPPQPPITRALGRSASALTKKISCREIRRQAPLLQAPQPFEPPAPPLFP